MKIKILGCGTINSSLISNCSGYLINERLLVDIGPGIWRALGQNRIANHSIGLIALTHFHTDHVSDLAPFLLERYLLSDGYKKNLSIIGPKGLKKWFTKLSGLYDNWISKLSIELIEKSGHNFHRGDFEFDMFNTPHTVNSICYRIKDKSGFTVFFSGDTDFDDSLINIARRSDLAIIECSNTEESKVSGHLTPFLAGKLAQLAGVKKLILTHLYPEVYKIDYLAEVKKSFTGEVMVAKDNMVLLCYE